MFLPTVRREMASCLDCPRDNVVDYHGGQYVHMQLGIQYAVCEAGMPVCGFIGINPSYQHYLVREQPSLSRYIDIAVTLGFGFPGVRTGTR